MVLGVSLPVSCLSPSGVKMKSSKTQTCFAPAPSHPPEPPQHPVILGPTHMTSADPAKTDRVPMAIPLGQLQNQ